MIQWLHATLGIICAMVFLVMTLSCIRKALVAWWASAGRHANDIVRRMK